MPRDPPCAPATADEWPYDSLFDMLPLGAYRARPDGVLLRANPALARLLGFADLRACHEALRAVPIDAYVEPGRRALFLERLARDGRVDDFESELRRHGDGRRIWIREHAHRVTAADGGTLFYEGTVEDITTRVRDQAAIGRNEQMMRQLAGHVPGMIYRVRASPDPADRGRFTFVSTGVRDLYGVEPEAVMANTTLLRSFCHPDDMARVDAEIDAAKRDSRPMNVAFRIVVGGRLKWVQMSSSAVASDGEDRLRVGVMIDVTAQRQAEELRRERDRAGSERRQMTQFLSRVSHELRTPLNAILGLAQLIESEPGTPALQRDWSRTLLDSGRHLLELVDDVLDLTGAQGGLMVMQTADVELAGVLRDAWGMVGAGPEAQGLRFGGVPAQATSLLVRADRRRLVQVLVNLLSNAVKYNRPGGRVELAVRREGAMVDVEVVDEGVGMTAEQMARLFSPFDRLGAQHGPVPGTGLGLALSRQLAEAMGGALHARSAPGQGCTFTLRLRGVTSYR